jgi:hypothetical protein
MKSHNIYLTRLVAVLALAILLVGCTQTLKSKKISGLKTGSPLKGIAPKIFAFKEFRDVRQVDPYRLSEFNRIKLDKPLADLIAMVIRKELERNGHTCITYSAQSKADFIIEGSVYKPVYIFDATAGVKLTIYPVSSEKRVFIKAYGSAGIGHAGDLKEQVDWLLLPLVKEMSTDPELIAFLEK